MQPLATLLEYKPRQFIVHLYAAWSETAFSGLFSQSYPPAFQSPGLGDCAMLTPGRPKPLGFHPQQDMNELQGSATWV